MALRHTWTWKQSADTVAHAARVQAEKYDALALENDVHGPSYKGAAKQFRDWEALTKGRAGVEYKLDAEDMEYFGLTHLTPGEIKKLYDKKGK